MSRSKLLCGLAALLVAACAERGAGRAGRLNFLLPQEASRAYVLDASWAPAMPLDPPFEAGLDQLTVLRDVDTPAMSVEQTLLLDEEGTLTALALGPDGDTALVAANSPNALFVVRGLRSGALRVDAKLPLPEPTVAMEIAPDGTWALLGNSSPVGPLVVTVVGGLDGEPYVDGRIDLGPADPFECGNIGTIRITDDGNRALMVSEYSPVHVWPFHVLPNFANLHIIADPGPGGAHQVVDVLALPMALWAIPPPDSMAGYATSRPSGRIEVMCDGDTVLVPMAGVARFGAPDARLLIVRGLSRNRLEIARDLGPADGVELTPADIVRLPNCDQAIMTNNLAGKISLISGLSDPTFQSVTIESWDTSISTFDAALTPSGERLLVARVRLPKDAHAQAIYQYDVTGGTVREAGPPLFGPVRIVPHTARQLATYRPGLSDYIACCTAHLPPTVNARLQESVTKAVHLADIGMDGRATEELAALETDVAILVQQGDLGPIEGQLVRDLVTVAQERLLR